MTVAAAAAPLLVPLAVSFVLSTLRLTLQPESSGVAFVLVSRNRNLSVSVQDGFVFADGVQVTRSRLLPGGDGARVSVHCLNDFALRIDVESEGKVVPSPSLCRRDAKNGLLVGPDYDSLPFHGCIRNAVIGTRTLFDSWCRSQDTSSVFSSAVSSDSAHILYSDGTPDHRPTQPLYIGENVRVAENGSTTLQWKNFYLFPEHRRFRITNTDVIFEVVDPPGHGWLRLGSVRGKAIRHFSYDDLIRKRVFYVHNGDENEADNFDLQLEIKNSKIDFGDLRQRTYTIKVEVEKRNDPPQIVPGIKGALVHVVPGVKTLLTEDHVKIWDADSPTDQVFVVVDSSPGSAKFTTKHSNSPLNKFSLSDLLNHKIYVSMDAARNSASAELSAIDRAGAVSGSSVVVRVTASEVELHMTVNTGVRLSHKSSVLISAQNLSFSLSSNIDGLAVPLSYVIIDQPEFGIVECVKADSSEGFQLCATFSQSDIDEFRVRYRHTSENRPKSDVFSFKVMAGDSESTPHDFRLEFIPVSVRVFILESLLLNNTEQAVIGRSNLVATTFPYSFPKDELVYHIVEPPKFGMLSRKLEGNKQRRIGVSSNFTQEHIDQDLVSYKLHFVHYSVVNDFFAFRLVTPAVTSELLRFEIIFIPGGNSIQLLNRTLVVPEGRSQKITNNTLSLETADDTTFDFNVVVPPFNGQFILTNPSGAKFILGLGDSFDSLDIVGGRLWYEHAGGESREDRAYLVAESRYQPSTRIPLWFTISIIAENDHPPELLRGEPENRHSVFVMERGERTLTPSLFPWTDRDSSDSVLRFEFTQAAFKDFAFFEKDQHQLPVTAFSSKDLREEKFVLRHLSLKKQATIEYVVSDGKHRAKGLVTFVAEKPFVRLQTGIVRVADLNFGGFVPVSAAHLTAQTNVDQDLGRIRFSIVGSRTSPFCLLEGGTLRSARDFSQRDVNDGRVFFAVQPGNPRPVDLSLRIADLEAPASVDVVVAPGSLQLKMEPDIVLTDASIGYIDRSVMDARSEPEGPIKIFVVEQPRFGGLSMDPPENKKLKSVTSDAFVWAFYLADVQAGRLRYIHQRTGDGSATTEDDVFSLRLVSNQSSFGPFNIRVKKQDSLGPVLSVLGDLRLPESGNASLDSRVLRLSTPVVAPHAIQLRISKQPTFGSIVSTRHPDEPLSHFTADQLTRGEIMFVSSGRADADSFSVIACAGVHCGPVASVAIVFERANNRPPEVVKNEPLVLFNTDYAVLGKKVLNVQDPDSPPEVLKFFIWQPIGGFVAEAADRSIALTSFSFADLLEDRVAFVSTANSSGGFSFLVSDGLHQTQAEWFTVERTAKLSLTLEANARLLAAPLQHSVIGMDLLRARIPDVSASKITFTVSRAPLHGRILMDRHAPVQKFTQADVDARRVSYRSDSAKLGAWSQKDYFNFIVSVDGQPSVREEFRFRISVTFGALTPDALRQFATVNPLRLTVGASLALNSSHLDLSQLEEACGDRLQAVVHRPPKKARLVFVQEKQDDATNSREDVSGAAMVPVHALSSGRHLVLHSTAPGDDELVLHVFASKEAGRRTARLRVPLYIEATASRSDVTVTRFREELTLVSGGSTPIDPTDFQADSDSLSPSELEYTVVQKGSNGVRVVVLDAPAERQLAFTQAQVNKGQVRLEHTPLSSDDRFDVLQLAVGGAEMRALIVRVEPLALNLFNHSDISYEQGRTYVVLNRQHLGADSNGDRSKIVYNVTRPPQNGTFYWVAGEKEADWFTQKNIDDGDILYAQLDMEAYQDSFEFTLGNEEMEMLQKSSRIVVLPRVDTQDLITDAKTITQVSVNYLNATVLQGATPRFLVISPPQFGRLFLHPLLNESVVFFTQTDVNDGRLFFHSFDVDERVDDDVEMELRGDAIQPARFHWHVDIRPIDKRLGVIEPGSRPSLTDTEDASAQTPKMVKELNQHFPVYVLAAIVVATVVILFCCRTSRTKKRRQQRNGAVTVDEQTLHLNLAEGTESSLGTTRLGTDLLDSTVYATVGRNRRESRGGLRDIAEEDSPTRSTVRRQPSLQQVSLETFEPSPPRVRITPLRQPLTMGSVFKPTALASIAARSSQSGPITSGLPSPATILKQPRGSLDTMRSGAVPPPQLKQNQYWV